ncbi:Hypothetical protein LCAKO_2p55 (plasmid) [Lacticaseibacillus paracasei subsp. paracasei]|uniref:Uncharacterized protein n=1 Tax=Lacticaseibacillus paracasei subsp. paracasei TaxID=47714 RepID=A0AAP9HKY4_LACPA|nr:Hypothetical protein LCAKO_2p55 [Lacticaseibacillus paracasei subsp. paracasei]
MSNIFLGYFKLGKNQYFKTDIEFNKLKPANLFKHYVCIFQAFEARRCNMNEY